MLNHSLLHLRNYTASFLQMSPLAAASGAEDGSVRLWDLLTGACVHKLDSGHHGRVTALTCTLTHVVSAGLDNRLCIWQRWNGHLLHWLHMVSETVSRSEFANGLSL